MPTRAVAHAERLRKPKPNRRFAYRQTPYFLQAAKKVSKNRLLLRRALLARGVFGFDEGALR
jgi:hypothetical protein